MIRTGPRWPIWTLVFLLVALHFVLRIGLGLGELAPDLLVVAVLLAAREVGTIAAAGLGFLLGVLDGAVVPFTLGASALVLTVLAYLGSRSREWVATDSLVFLALYLFVGKWLFDTLLYLVFYVSGHVLRPDLIALLVVSPLAALYAALAGLLATVAYRTVT